MKNRSIITLAFYIPLFAISFIYSQISKKHEDAQDTIIRLPVNKSRQIAYLHKK